MADGIPFKVEQDAITDEPSKKVSITPISVEQKPQISFNLAPAKIIAESETRRKIAIENADKIQASLYEHRNTEDVNNWCLGIFGKDVFSLSPQEMAVFGIDFAGPNSSAKVLMNVLANESFHRLYSQLSAQEQASLLKENLFTNSANLTKNFFSSFLEGKTYSQLEQQDKTLIDRRVRRLATLTQASGVFLRRKNMQILPTGEDQARSEFVSAGERFPKAVVEKEDVMSFILFGVPVTETSADERSFINSPLVGDLEQVLGIYQKDSFFEDCDIRFLLAKIKETRHSFHSSSEQSDTENSYFLGRALVNPKDRPKLKELVGPKDMVIREQEGPVNITVYLKGAKTETARELVDLINLGYSQEEALMVLDERLAQDTIQTGNEKKLNAFLIGQKVRNDGNVEVEWSNVGDNVVFVISNGEIVYDNGVDPAKNESLGSIGTPIFVSNYKGNFPSGSEILVLPNDVLSKIRKEDLLRLISEHSAEKVLEIGQLSKQLASQGVKGMQKIEVGQTGSGEKLVPAIEKSKFSQDESERIQHFVSGYLEQVLSQVPKGSKISVEAAHIYAHLSFKLEHALGAQLGGMVSNTLKQLGFNPQNELFIDNFNAPVKFIAAQRNEETEKVENLNKAGQEYARRITERGFKPDYLVWEADMVKLAQQTVDKMITDGKVEQKEGDWFLKGTNVKLYDGKRGIYTCPMLDSMRSVQELDKYPYTITVLPEYFDGQQDDMKAIVSVLGQDPSKIINIAFNLDKIKAIKTGSAEQVVDF